MLDDYSEQLKSDVADLKNVGGRAPARSRPPGSCASSSTTPIRGCTSTSRAPAYSETDLGWLPKGRPARPPGTFVEFVRGRAG
jgi:leucyl aminopeptidase